LLTLATDITEKAGFSFEEFPKVRAYMDAIRSRSGPAENAQASGTLDEAPTIRGFIVDFGLCPSTI